MELAKDLIQEFASVTDDRPDVLPETTCYGTARFVEGADYVVIDGADVRTPAIFTVKALDGDRVMVMLKARKAVVIANISNPTLMVGTLIANTGIVVKGYITTNEARTVYNDTIHNGLTFSAGGMGAYSTLGSWWLKNDGTFQLGGSNGITFSDSKVRFGDNVILSWNNLPDGVANNDDIPQNLDDLPDGSTYKHWNTEIGKTWIQTANITCQNLKVANAASMGTGVNSIKYNSSTGKIEFGSGVVMSWGNVDHPTIPTDVNQLADASGQKWSTSVGNTWIQTANVTCQNLTVANAIAMGTGANSIKYNSTSGKIEFGANVQLSWSSGISGKPTIPTDVNQLADASGQKWSTSVGATWIQTADVTCQNLKVANATSIGSGANSIKYNSTSGKIEFGTNVKLSWSNLSDVPAGQEIPTDISDLTDNSNKLWTTEIAGNWIKTAQVTCQNLTVANAIAMGTGANSIKYNSTSGKIEFGANVQLSWSSGISGKPTIPTDVNQLADASGQKWSTSVGNTWIQTADVTCQNLTVANAIAMGTGANSIKYNSTSGKIEFGANVQLSWSSGISGKPTIPTDVNQLADASGQKWSTSVGNTWIQTADVTCQNLTVANAIAMGTGANSIKYNSTSGKIEFGANVQLSWSSGISGKPTIPTDVNQLADASGQKWSTSVGNTWIQTANVTCQNLTVANAIAMGTGANSIKYNSTSGKIEFGANVQLSWSSGISGKPTIPTDVNQLADASGQKWSTSVGNTWIKTSDAVCQNLVVQMAKVSGSLSASRIAAGTIGAVLTTTANLILNDDTGTPDATYGGSVAAIFRWNGTEHGRIYAAAKLISGTNYSRWLAIRAVRPLEINVIGTSYDLTLGSERNVILSPAGSVNVSASVNVGYVGNGGNITVGTNGTNDTGDHYCKVVNKMHSGSLSTHMDNTPAGYLGIWSDTASKWLIRMSDMGTFATNTTSDIRYKNIVGNMTVDEALTILRSIDIINFTYKGDMTGVIQNGVSAQQLRDVLIKENIGLRGYLLIDSVTSKDVYYDLNTPEEKVKYGIDYQKFTPILWKGWQIHDEIIDSHEARIKALEEELKKLKGAA